MKIFCERIRQLRKEKKWSQTELAQKINTDTRQISRYERGKITPYAETIVKIAQVFDVSTDHLLMENAPRKPFRINNSKLLQHIEYIEKLNDNEKNCLLLIIDAFMAKNRIKNFAQEIKDNETNSLQISI